MKRHMGYRTGLLLVLAAALGLAGCSAESRRDRHLAKADAYLAAQKYNEAVLELMNALRTEPTNAATIRKLGLAHADAGHPRDALPFLAKTIQDYPDDTEARLKLAKIFAAAGDARRAREEAGNVLETSPQDFEALMIWAESTLRPDQIEPALARLMASEAAYGTKPRFHMAAGLLYQRRPDPASAERAFRRAAELDPKSADPLMALADLEMLRGNKEQAGPLYAQAAALPDANPMAWIKLSGYKLRTGEPAEALKILTDLTARKPDFLPALYGRAEFAFAEHKFDECLKLLDQILRGDPGHYQGLVLRARTLLAKGDYDELIKEADTLLKDYPHLSVIRYHLAHALLRKNQAERARDELAKALESEPGYADAILLQAELNIRSGKADLAVDALEQLAANRPELPNTYVLLGTAYRNLQKPELALQAYDRLSKLNPKNAQGPYMMGLIYAGQGRRDDAVRALEKANELSPPFVLPVTALVALDLKEKNYDRAIQRVETKLQVVTNSPELHFLLGRVRQAQGQLDLAEQAWRRALEVQPRFVAAYIEIAKLAVAAGRTDDALREVRQSLEANPRSESLLMMAGVLHQERKEFKDAAEIFEKAIEVNPKFVAALNNLAYIYQEHLDKSDRALALAKQANELAPQDPLVADTLGWIAYHRGDYKWALTLLQESAAQLGDHAEVLYHLGLTQYAMGDEASAQDSLRKALAASPSFPGREEAAGLLEVLSMNLETIGAEQRSVVETTLKSDPQNAAALTRLAAIEMKSGGLREARRLYELALKARPAYAPAAAGLAAVLAEDGEAKQALEWARKALDMAPADPGLARSLGWTACRAGDFTWGHNLLKDNPPTPADPNYAARRGYAEFMVGRLDEAAQSLQTALAASGEFAMRTTAQDAKQMLDAYRGEGDAAAASDRARALLNADKTYLPARLALAMDAKRSGNTKDALEILGEIIADHSDFAPALKQAAALNLALGKTDRALKLGQKAREQWPHDTELARTMGLAAAKEGQHEWAIQLLKERREAAPNDATNLFHLGMLLCAGQESDAGRKALEQAINLGLDADLGEQAREAISAKPR